MPVSPFLPTNGSIFRLLTSVARANRTCLLQRGVRHYSSATVTVESDALPKSQIQIVRTIGEVRKWRREQLLAGYSVGLVPTMGALHKGHLDLVKASMRMNDRTIVSIFVNPSQFAPTEDLESYPRDFDADVEQLASINGERQVDVIFAPSVEEMYPSGIPLDISEQTGAFVTVHGVSEQLEGKIRPQFFRGVATVVSKFLNIVQPDRIYFGQKDVQQTVVVKRLVKDLCYGSVVHVVPTARDENGLALSSRNSYLTDEVRADAAVISQALQDGLMVSREDTSAKNIAEAVINKVADKFDRSDIEYVSVSDPETLADLESVHPLRGAIVSLAVRVPNRFGTKTRLIDNIII